MQNWKLIFLLKKDNHIQWSRCNEFSWVVTDSFLMHPDSLNLANAFNIVFLMDNNYTTIKYRLSLLKRQHNTLMSIRAFNCTRTTLKVEIYIIQWHILLLTIELHRMWDWHPSFHAWKVLVCPCLFQIKCLH